MIVFCLGLGAFLGWISGKELITRYLGEKVSVEVEKVDEIGARDINASGDVIYNGKKYYTHSLPLRVKRGDKVDVWYCPLTDDVVSCTVSGEWILFMFGMLILSIALIGIGVYMCAGDFE